MRLEKGISRSIHFVQPKSKKNKTIKGISFAEKLHEIANSLEEDCCKNEEFCGVKCLWRGGIYIEIHATQPK